MPISWNEIRDRVFHQAKDYFPGIKDHDLPRYVLVSDFLFDLYQQITSPLEERKARKRKVSL